MKAVEFLSKLAWVTWASCIMGVVIWVINQSELTTPEKPAEAGHPAYNESVRVENEALKLRNDGLLAALKEVAPDHSYIQEHPPLGGLYE